MTETRTILLVRLAVLLPGGIALLLGLDAALLLLGLPAPLRAEWLPEVHGVLLVLGFAGTLVALERAVALGRAWGYLAPVGLGLGGLALGTAPGWFADGMFVLGAAALVAVYVPLWRRQPAGAVVVEAAGAVLATGAALLWLGGVAVAALLPFLVGFLVLTIAGERLELARVAFLAPRAEQTAVGLSGLVVAGALAALLWPEPGHALYGAAVLGLAGWLTYHDVARRTVHTSGLPRYAGVCLLAGYAWLAVAGAIWLLVGPVTGGPAYDAAVHAVFLGFVVSMVMAHAPVILPAVLRRPLPYRPVMYLPVGLLHASLVLRVVGGDARGSGWAWQVGGAVNVAAVLLFVAVVILATTSRPAQVAR